jgi:hypothetical protein
VSQKLSPSQWEIIEEIGRDLKKYAEALPYYELDNPIRSVLRDWAHALAVLGWEAYESSVTLVREGLLRGAFAIGRSLLDYYFRLNYYIDDAKKYAPPVDYIEGELLPAGCLDLFKTFAWRDWNNSAEKMWWYMQQIPDHNLSKLSDEERKAFEDMIRRETKHYQTTVKKMLSKLKGNPAHVSEIKAEYGMRSGYLHGDQSAVYELFVSTYEDERPTASFEARFSEHRILGSNAQIALLLMDAIGEATGRTHATNVLLPKLFAAFGMKM